MAQTNEQKPVTKKKTKAEKNKKPGFFARMWHKIKDTFLELKRVTWPSFGKTLKSTGVVLVIVLVFTVIITGINTGFGALLKLITQQWGM